MQNSEKNKKTASKPQKNNIFKVFLERLREKDEREVRGRLRAVVEFFITAAVAYLLGGAHLFFGTYPLCIALLCSSRKHLWGIASGLLLLIIVGDLPAVYIFSCIAVILVRILATLIPVVFADTTTKEGHALVKRQSSGVVAASSVYATASETVLESKGGSAAVCENEREVRRGGLFFEPLHIRAICAAIGGFICGLFLLVRGDFSFYSLCATMTLTGGCALAVVLLGGYFGERQDRQWYVLISLGAIFALCTYASLNKSIIGMPMAPFLAMLISLFMTSSRGLWIGAASAAICGAVFNVLYIPLLVLATVLFYIVSAVRKNVGLAAVCGLVVLWCYYIGGSDGLVSVLPPMLLSIPFYMLADKYREMMFAPYNRAAVLSGGVYFAEAVTEKNKNLAVKERLGALSDAFSSLSETFYKLSDRFRRPDLLGIKRMTEMAFETHCEGCRNRELCWGTEYADTLEAIKRVTSALHTKNVAEASDMTEAFAFRCIRQDKILDEVNSGILATTEQIIKGDKAGVFASNYDDITSILKDALSFDGEEYECDMQAAEKIFDYLYGEGLRVSGVVVYGKRRLNVVAKGVSLSDKMSARTLSDICRKISEIVGVPLGEPVFEIGEDGSLMLLSSKPLLYAKCAHGRICAHSGGNGDDLYVDPFEDEECGDTTNAFVTDSSYFYSLISDGMGSGAEAAFTSGVCSMFIEKMLTAGNRADITLRMLNNVIRSENMGCGSECSATVDLFELDLINGNASFIKSGAAPTYIVRGETVYKINSRTMPVGIIKDADARITKFDTQRGDIIIMMSDGCCPDSDDCPWLVEFLCDYTAKRKKAVDIGGEDCERLKDRLLGLAVKNYPQGRERDDISVSVVMIE